MAPAHRYCLSCLQMHAIDEVDEPGFEVNYQISIQGAACDAPACTLGTYSALITAVWLPIRPLYLQGCFC